MIKSEVTKVSKSDSSKIWDAQQLSYSKFMKCYNFAITVLLLGSVLLTPKVQERCRTDNFLPHLPVSCLPPGRRRVDSKVLGLNVIGDRSHWELLSQVVLGRPTGLHQSDGGRSAAETTWWWSSSWDDRARCPKNFSREHFTLSETGEQPVMLRTVSFVVCLVYGIRKVLQTHQVSKALRRLARLLLTVHVSHP